MKPDFYPLALRSHLKSASVLAQTGPGLRLLEKLAY